MHTADGPDAPPAWLARTPFAIVALALTLFFFTPVRNILFTGEVPGPFDQLATMSRGEVPEAPFDVLQADAALQFYVWRDLVLTSWSQREVPLWNPYVLMGTPLLANSQSGALYPLHVLLGSLGVPATLAIGLLALFHLVVAGMGVRAIALRLGASPLGALVGGLLFAHSAFMVSWMGLSSVITTVAWIPWVWVGLERAMQGHINAEPREVALGVAGTGAALALVLLGGHLQFAAYGGIAAALYLVGRALMLKRVKLLGVGAAGLVLGAVLSAAQVLPVLALSQEGHRQAEATSEGYAAYTASSVSPAELTLVVHPMLAGNPQLNAQQVLDTPFPLPGFWPIYDRPGANFAESAWALSPLLLLLLLGARWRGTGAVPWPLALVGGVGLLLALGTPLGALLYFGFPGWSATGSPGRASVLFVLAACTLAALAWPRASTEAPEPVGVLQDPVRRAVVITLALVFLAWTSLALGWVTQSPIAPLAAFTAVPSLVFATAFGIGAFVMARRPLPQAPIFSFAMVIFAIFSISWGGLREVVPTGAPPSMELLGDIRFVENAGDPTDPNFRAAFANQAWDLVAPAATGIMPNLAASLRIRDVGGYDSLIPRQAVEVLREINRGEDPAPPANGNMMLVWPQALHPQLAEAGVSAMFLPGHFQGAPTAAARTFHPLTISGEVPGRASLTTKAGETVPVAWVHDGFSRQVLQVTGPGTLTVRDTNLPGWTATVSGNAQTMPTGRWRVLEIPEGTHEVVFRYSPPGWLPGLSLTGVGLVALLLLVFWRPRLMEYVADPVGFA